MITIDKNTLVVNVYLAAKQQGFRLRATPMSGKVPGTINAVTKLQPQAEH